MLLKSQRARFLGSDEDSVAKNFDGIDFQNPDAFHPLEC